MNQHVNRQVFKQGLIYSTVATPNEKESDTVKLGRGPKQVISQMALSINLH